MDSATTTAGAEANRLRLTEAAISAGVRPAATAVAAPGGASVAAGASCCSLG